MEEINKLGEVLKVEVNEGVTLRYLKAGKGAPMILLHTIRTQLDYFQEVNRAEFLREIVGNT